MKDEKTVGIFTLYSGFNYGSALQAFALKVFIEKLGYKAKIIDINKPTIKGRNIYISKVFYIGFRYICHPFKLKKPLLAYFESPSNSIDSGSKIAFNHFYDNVLDVTRTTKRKLIKDVKNENYLAFVSGSDQIWNSATIYVDKKYYLRFVPKRQRVAYAPSFGRDFIPDYNKRIISKYISEYRFLSIRESSGAELISNCCNLNAEVLCDPTLLLSKEEWARQSAPVNVKGKYILLYFLGKPNDNAISVLKQLDAKYGFETISIPFGCNNIGPKEFVNLVQNAEMVLTDSYHGTIFSIIFNKCFYVFERNYKSASNQSTRIVDLLKKLNILYLYNPIEPLCEKIPFDNIKRIIDSERNKSATFLKSSFLSIEEDD